MSSAASSRRSSRATLIRLTPHARRFTSTASPAICSRKKWAIPVWLRSILQNAKEKYRSVASDRGRIYVIHGEPLEVKAYGDPACRLLQPLEVWQYGFIPELGHNVQLIFYQPRMGVDYRLWLSRGTQSENL